ncbi:MAG: hypothetical protein J0I77_14365 [Rudaea sp.]|uniref:hypothetical protein n=1 Tax=unclassified Rudaea TaxID=2627037 RepID=UPI0010F7EBEA|nr:MULTISPECIES: hypothetical protein [unclassified Rudaea]MBN8886901.1 hypothetical protein [Rudaea sp.]
MSRISTLILAACAVAGAALALPAAAQTAAPAKSAAPAKKAATPAAKDPAPKSDTGAPPEDPAFKLFRHDLINLLALSGDPRKQIAAAQIAAPDEGDASRSAIKKTSALVKRALELGPQDPLVLWIASSNACLTQPGCANPAALKTLQTVDPDNTAVWLLAYPTDSDADKQRAAVARMAQTQRYNDFWGADVVALYHALEVLPVPKAITSLGLSSESARINFATSIASAFLPVPLQRLHQFCTKLDAANDATAISDCIAVARKLEAGGTFVAQGIGFAIEEALLSPGVDKDVMATRRRSAAWQKERFMELSGRFAHEPALAQAYIEALEKEPDEPSAVVAFLRAQKERTDPPGDWQPAPPLKTPDALQSPAPQQ